MFFPRQQLFWDLLKWFCNHHLNFQCQGTISSFSTPDCQSDPEWNPKKSWRLSISLLDTLAGFSLGWGLSINQRKTCQANSAPLLVTTPTCRFSYLALRDSKTWYPAHFTVNRRKVLPTAIGGRTPSGFLAQLVSHQRSKAEVRKVLFLRESHSKDLLGLGENSVQFARSTWQSNVRNLGQNANQPCTKAVGEGHESLVDKKFRGWETIDICGVRNRTSFPLRMFQLEGSVVVGREICNLVIAYCHFDSV